MSPIRRILQTGTRSHGRLLEFRTEQKQLSIILPVSGIPQSACPWFPAQRIDRIPVPVVRIGLHHQRELLQIIQTRNRLPPLSCLVQSRKKKSKQDHENGYNDKKFNQSKLGDLPFHSGLRIFFINNSAHLCLLLLPYL